MSELHVDLAARLVNLTSAVRSAFAVATAGLPEPERARLARAAVEQLEALATAASASAPQRTAFRPVIVRSDASDSAIYEPPAGAPAARRPLPAELPVELERKMLAILADSPRPGETIELAFRRKEVALGELFGSLPLASARALHRRLVAPTPFDPLAQTFARFVFERRARLLGFLADAPRRAAMKRGA